MIFRKKSYIRLNIFYIISFIIFLIIFPFLRNYLNGNELSVNKGAIFLNLANKSTGAAFDSFNGLLGYFYSKKYLLNEIDRLKNELNSKEINSIIENNTEEKNLSNHDYDNDNDMNIVVAKKIFSDFTTIYDTILLNKGVDSGIKENNLVFVNDNSAVGEVSKVYKNTSLITLFSKNKEKVEGVIIANKNQNTVLLTNFTDLQEENKNEENSSSLNLHSDLNNLDNLKALEKGSSILIDLYGYGGGDFISYIPNNIEISTGTKVYLAIDESKILGEVVDIEKPDASFFQVLIIRGFYNTRKNDNYYILKN